MSTDHDPQLPAAWDCMDKDPPPKQYGTAEVSELLANLRIDETLTFTHDGTGLRFELEKQVGENRWRYGYVLSDQEIDCGGLERLFPELASAIAWARNSDSPPTKG